VGTTNVLNAVSQRGAVIWIGGARGVALRSLDSGASFAFMSLKLDPRGDVRSVWVQSSDSIYVAGGGGFIRRSLDGGATWEFLKHSMNAPISDFCIAGAVCFASNDRNRVVLSTIDRGTTWRLPTGATITRTWAHVQRRFRRGPRQEPSRSTPPTRGPCIAPLATASSTATTKGETGVHGPHPRAEGERVHRVAQGLERMDRRGRRRIGTA
jgi:hypothetical protein